MTASEQQVIKSIQDVYYNVLKDTTDGMNLETNFQDVQGAITHVETLIKNISAKGGATDNLKTLKNDLYYLLFEIKERL